jgi:hypothetical protein
MHGNPAMMTLETNFPSGARRGAAVDFAPSGSSLLQCVGAHGSVVRAAALRLRADEGPSSLGSLLLWGLLF